MAAVCISSLHTVARYRTVRWRCVECSAFSAASQLARRNADAISVVDGCCSVSPVVSVVQLLVVFLLLPSLSLVSFGPDRYLIAACCYLCHFMSLVLDGLLSACWRTPDSLRVLRPLPYTGARVAKRGCRAHDAPEAPLTLHA